MYSQTITTITYICAPFTHMCDINKVYSVYSRGSMYIQNNNNNTDTYALHSHTYVVINHVYSRNPMYIHKTKTLKHIPQTPL